MYGVRDRLVKFCPFDNLEMESSRDTTSLDRILADFRNHRNVALMYIMALRQHCIHRRLRYAAHRG